MSDSARHQWGPAPSGQPQHRAVCRQCGLVEITTWHRDPEAEVIEVVAWVAPTGEVLASRPVRSQPVPLSPGRLPVLKEYAVLEPATVEALTRCPGTPEAWES
jgi:hypothetical protein